MTNIEITENPEHRIKALVKELFLTPGPSGGQLYSINEIIREVNKKEPMFGRMVNADRIYEWAYDRDVSERPSWVDLVALGAKLNLKTVDRLEDRSWEETIYQKMFEMEALMTNEQMMLKQAAINQISTAIEEARQDQRPVFRDMQEALFALSTSTGGLLSSFNPMLMRTVLPSGGKPKRKR
jgi:hypothetical protein